MATSHTKAPKDGDATPVVADPADDTPDLPTARFVPAVTSQVLGRFLATATEVGQEDPEQIAMAIVERILNAKDVAEVLTPNQVVHARDIIGVPLNVTGIRWLESDFETGPGMYAIMDCVRTDTEASLVVSCGGQNVLAQLWKLNDLGAFPCRVVIQQASRPTKAGFLPLWLEAGPVPFEG
jgi:hypothetical protein